MVNIRKCLYIIVLPLVLILSSCDKQDDISSHIKVGIGSDGGALILEAPLPTGFVSAGFGVENPTPISYSVTDPSNLCDIYSVNTTGAPATQGPNSGTTYNGNGVFNGFLNLSCSTGADATVNINFTIGHQQYYGSIEYKP